MSDANDQGDSKPKNAKKNARPVEIWLRESLEKGGVPLEMKTAQRFLASQFHVAQSDYYEDVGRDGERTWREIDVHATLAEADVEDVEDHEDGLSIKTYGVLALNAVVECKGGRDKAWVVLTTEDKKAPSSAASTMCNEAGLSMLRRTPRRVRDLLHGEQPRRGYGLLKAGEDRSEDDSAYRATMQVLSAASTFVSRGAAADRNDGIPWARIVLPVLVVSGSLFECYLDAAGQLVLERCECRTFVRRQPVAGLQGVAVHVVQEDALDDYIERISSAFRALWESRASLREVFAAERARWAASAAP